ncbi:HDOD domain-containing protein [Hydrogenimonas sp.]
MVEKIIKKIKSLPPLPESVAKVRRICDDPEGSIKDLVPVIKSDPLFTADILKAANSPLYGFSRQITSIDQAISLFGMGTIQGFAISYAIRNTMPVDLGAYNASSGRLMDVSSLQNSLTLHWGKELVTAHRQEMMTVSLLMELGKVVASVVLDESNQTEPFAKAIKNAETSEEIIHIEKEFLGISSEWIAALMFKHWQFHRLMIEMMRHVLDPLKADDTVKRHTQILHVVKEAIPFTKPMCDACIQSAYEKADHFGFDTAALQRAIESMRQ